MGAFSREAVPVTRSVNPAGTILNGDLLMHVTPVVGAFYTAARQTNAAAYAGFIGVAEGQVPIASNIDNATGLENQILVRENGVFNFKTTAGETYTDGLGLKMGADNQTVALDGGANQVIGYVFLPRGEIVTGAAGVTVPVRIHINYPSADFAG